MLNSEIRAKADYQKFQISVGRIVNAEGRMLDKVEALSGVLPDVKDKKVLDIGCDFGFWSFMAAQQGAEVLGLDRSREVRGIGHVDIPKLNNETAQDNNFNAEFLGFELGHQWWDIGNFDVAYMMSLYHHVFQNTGGDHESIWFWLSQMADEVIWENPLEADDSVVQLNVNPVIHPLYNEGLIRKHAYKYFDITYEGPALHETTRVVWKLKRKPAKIESFNGRVINGAGGASKAFVYDNERRIDELEFILGMRPIPGSMNVLLDRDFNWASGYYRTGMLDVTDRSKGLNSQWNYKPVRLYPVKVGTKKAFAMRFEGEGYPLNFVELISDERLNTKEHVTVEQWL